MLPGCFEPVLHLEGGVRDDQVVFCTEGEEPEPVAVHFPHSMLANDMLPYQMFCAHSSIEISQENDFVCCWGFLYGCFMRFLAARLVS